MRSLLSLIDRISVWLATGAAVALVLLALFTFTDVVLRYLFNRPIVGSIDIIELILFVLVFFALPYAGRSGGHIVVDLVPDYRNERLTRSRDATVKLIPAFVFGVLTWQSWLRISETAVLGEASNMLEIPFWPFFCVMTAATAFYTIALILECLLLIGGGRAGSISVGVDDGLRPETDRGPS